MGRGILGEDLDGSGDPRGSPGLVEEPSRRSGTGQVHYGKYGMGRGTNEVVRDRSGDPKRGLGPAG